MNYLSPPGCCVAKRPNETTTNSPKLSVDQAHAQASDYKQGTPGRRAEDRIREQFESPPCQRIPADYDGRKGAKEDSPPGFPGRRLRTLEAP